MKGIYLRKVEYSDMELIYRWAIDPIVRNNSFNIDTITYENHVKWFVKMMSDISVLQFILMDGNVPVGQIRLNINGDEAEIGYSIVAEFRGKGYGRRILQLAYEEIKASHPEISKLVAKVKPDNIISNQLFGSEGYELQYYCYKIDINK